MKIQRWNKIMKIKIFEKESIDSILKKVSFEEKRKNKAIYGGWETFSIFFSESKNKDKAF
jgi:hypothetical protein